jgi:hypothetical protein
MNAKRRKAERTRYHQRPALLRVFPVAANRASAALQYLCGYSGGRGCAGTIDGRCGTRFYRAGRNGLQLRSGRTRTKYRRSRYPGSRYPGSRYPGSRYSGSRYSGSRYSGTNPWTNPPRVKNRRTKRFPIHAVPPFTVSKKTNATNYIKRLAGDAS